MLLSDIKSLLRLNLKQFMGLNPLLWGPSIWRLLHYLGYNLDIKINKNLPKIILLNIIKLLPCKICELSATDYIKMNYFPEKYYNNSHIINDLHNYVHMKLLTQDIYLKNKLNTNIIKKHNFKNYFNINFKYNKKCFTFDPMLLNDYIVFITYTLYNSIIQKNDCYIYELLIQFSILFCFVLPKTINKNKYLNYLVKQSKIKLNPINNSNSKYKLIFNKKIKLFYTIYKNLRKDMNNKIPQHSKTNINNHIQYINIEYLMLLLNITNTNRE